MRYQVRLRLVLTVLVLTSAVVACRPAAAQIRGHWRLQETSGTTAVDTSTFADNGTYTNGVALATSTPVPSDGAIAAKFDGFNDYLTIPNESSYDFTGAMTVACWIKVDVFDADFQAIVCKGNSAWRLAREGSTNFVQFACTGLTTFKVVSVTSVNDGQWHHVAGVYTGSQLQIYIDGQLDNSVASSGFISTNAYAVEIGRNGEAAGREFDGAIYNVVVYNGALSGSNIQTIYNWDALTANWKLNQTSGTVATDSSISPNNGTYTNGVVLAATGPYPGAGDKAADFDGVNDYVATANEFNYDLAGPMSVAAWIKVDSFTKQWQAIVTKGDSAWRLLRDDTNNGVTFACTGLSTLRVASVTSVNDGAWHHVVGVYTGSQLQIYVDGKLDNAVASTGAISRNGYNVEIARNAEVAGKEFDGKIHDVRVYSVALSASKVSALYGLVGHWKLDQVSGTTATDSSPCATNGTVSGTATWSTDCGGMGVFDFNGSTNYVSVTNASHLQPPTALVVAAWIKGDTWGAGTDVDVILRKGEGSPNNYQLAVTDGKVTLYLEDTDGAGVKGNTVLATGQWYHVAAVWDSSTVKIYVNGILDNTPATRTGSIGTDTRPLYIGGRATTDLFDGMMRDVRFYNRALYESEIKYLAGLIGFWKFAEGSGTTAADSSGQANTATLSGGATWMTDCAGNKALQTSGVGGIAQTSSFKPPDVGTVAFWMQSNGNPSALGRIFGLGGDWEARHMTDGTVVFDLCGEGGTDFVTTMPLNEVGRWYHVAATFDAATDAYAVYIDGQLNKSGTNTNAMSAQVAAALSFGTRTGSAEYWLGALRDFRVYSRRLCPTEIAELYGLVGHWKLDETSGITAADSSGLGRNGLVVGTANWIPAAVDNGLELNGSTRMEVNSLLGSPKNVSLAAWARLTTADSGGAEVVSLGDYLAIRLNETASTSRAFFYNGSTWVSATVNQSFASTGWHHFAAVMNDDQNLFKFYVDGAEVASVSTTATIPYTGLGTKTVVGAHGNSGTTWDMTGRVDDVRVYSRALCPTEVQALHDGGDPFEGVQIIKWVEIQ
jgi:hypothetical protein